MAVLADALTAARIAIALVLVAGPSPRTAVLLLATAWLTDALDGSLARRAVRPTRLGWLDRPVDALVGLALLWYLVGHDVVPALPAGLVAGALLAVWAVTRVLAAQMLFLTLLYATVGWWAFTEPVPGRWILVATALIVLAAERRRFRHELVPEFLAGIAGFVRRHTRGSIP